MNEHVKECLFQTLELLRKTMEENWTLKSEGSEKPDWKDVDNYIFSALDWTASELNEVYKDHNKCIHTGSAVQK